MTFAQVIGMMWFDALFYWILTWYIEGVHPGKCALSFVADYYLDMIQSHTHIVGLYFDIDPVICNKWNS